jgi:hypothetical protein
MFDSKKRGLNHPLRDAIEKIYRDLKMPIAYSLVNVTERPLTLFALDQQALNILRLTIPQYFHRFCSFKVDPYITSIRLE